MSRFTHVRRSRVARTALSFAVVFGLLTSSALLPADAAQAQTIVAPEEVHTEGAPEGAVVESQQETTTDGTAPQEEPIDEQVGADTQSDAPNSATNNSAEIPEPSSELNLEPTTEATEEASQIEGFDPQAQEKFERERGLADNVRASPRLTGPLVYRMKGQSNFWPIVAGYNSGSSAAPKAATDYASNSVDGVLAKGADARWSLPAIGETGMIFKVGGAFDGWCWAGGLGEFTTFNAILLYPPAQCNGGLYYFNFTHTAAYTGHTQIHPVANPSQSVMFPSSLQGVDMMYAFLGHSYVSEYPVFATGPLMPPPADVGNSMLEVTPGSRLANDTEYHTVTATIRSSIATGSVPVEGASVSFKMYNQAGTAQTSNSRLDKVTVTTDGNGKATARIYAKVAATYAVEAKVGGVEISGSRARFALFENPVAPVQESYLEGTPGDRWADNVDTHTLTARVYDSTGKPVVGQIVNFAMYNANGTTPATLATLETPDAFTNEQGIAVSRVTARYPANYVARALVNGKEIKNSGAVKLNFVNPGCTLLNNSSLAVSTGTRVADGVETHSVTANVGGSCTGAVVTFKVYEKDGRPTSSAVITPSALSTGGNAYALITSTRAGEFMVEATVEGAHVKGSRERFVTFVDRTPIVDHQASYLAVSSGNRAADGVAEHSATATILSTAATGHDPMDKQVVTFKVTNMDGSATSFASIAGPTSSGTGKTAATGQVTVPIQATRAGEYRVWATVAGSNITHSGVLSVKFVDIVDHKTSNLTVSGDERLADGIDMHQATATIVSTTGLPIANKQVTFGIYNQNGTSTSNAVIATTPKETDPQGRATVNITATKAGIYMVEATVGGEHIGGSRDRYVAFISVSAPGVDHAKSQLTATPGAKVPNGTDAHTATALIVSTAATPMQGQDVTFRILNENGTPTTTATIAGAGTSGTVQTGADGKAYAPITATQDGRYRVEATVGGVPIGSSGQVYVLFADVVDPVKSQLLVSDGSQLANGVAKHTATATILSTTGKPLPLQNVTFSIFTESGATTTEAVIAPTTMLTDLTGNAAVSITATKPGRYMVRASVGGAEISGSGTQFAYFVDVVFPLGLTAEHSVSKPQVGIGEEFTYSVVFRNGGPSDAPAASLTFKLPAGLEIVAQSATGYASGSGNWFPKDGLMLNEEKTLTLTVKANAAGVYKTNVSRVANNNVTVCTTNQPACGAAQTVTVGELTPPTMVCPATPNQTGILTLSGGGVPVLATGVRVYAVKAGSAQPVLLGTATLAGSGSSRTWSFTNVTALEAGKYSITVRAVDASGTESKDSTPACAVAVVPPVQIKGSKLVEPVAQASGWVSVAEASNWEITLSEGVSTQKISGGASGSVAVGKTYTVGERLSASPAPGAVQHAQKGDVVCLDGGNTALPSNVFDPATGAITLDPTGTTVVQGPVSCAITNQTAHVSFVTQRVGGQTVEPPARWKLNLNTGVSAHDVALDDVHAVREALPSAYTLSAEPAPAFTVTAIDRLRLDVPNCAAAANNATTAPAACWERIGTTGSLSSVSLPQGKHSVFRVVAEFGVIVPPLPMTGGIGSWQYSAAGAIVLLLASVTYWRRSRLTATGVRHG